MSFPRDPSHERDRDRERERQRQREQDDDRLDLGALDPSRDRARWAALVASVASRAEDKARRASVPRQLLVLARPALALAAVLALVVWGAAYFDVTSGVEVEAAPTDVLARWAQNDELPAPTQIFDVIGAVNAAE